MDVSVVVNREYAHDSALLTHTFYGKATNIEDIYLIMNRIDSVINRRTFAGRRVISSPGSCPD